MQYLKDGFIFVNWKVVDVSCTNLVDVDSALLPDMM